MFRGFRETYTVYCTNTNKSNDLLVFCMDSVLSVVTFSDVYLFCGFYLLCKIAKMCDRENQNVVFV